MNSKNQGRVAALMASLIVAAGIVSIAGPAQAATGDCPSGSACIWRDSNYATSGVGSALVKFAMYIPDYGTWNYAGTSLNGGNSATSVYNNGNSQNTYYFDNNNPTDRNTYQFVLSIKTGDARVYDTVGNVQSKPDNTLSAGYFSSYLP